MRKIKILFVCHGNICRSPMAEFIMKDLVSKAHLEDRIYIESAATSREEIGNPVYPPARKVLASVGLHTDGKTARQVTKQDYDIFDYLVVMERYNIRNLERIIGDDTQGKVSRLLEFTGKPADIADPWYSGDFDTTYREILEGCQALLAHIQAQDL